MTHQEIEIMREGGRILATVLETLRQATVPGVTSAYLGDLAAKEVKALGASPAFLGVPSSTGAQPFPHVICISVSEEVQHAIPHDRVIIEGDVVNFDFGVKHRGLMTDAGFTFGVGKIGPEAQRLLEGTKQALEAGLAKVRDGVLVSEISAAIERVLKQHRLGIVEELVGHGIGYELHQPPEIPNYSHKSQVRLQAGQTVAIEPIATLGTGRIRLAPDGWTLLSADNTLGAHFEHTIVVTESGHEILTKK